MNILVSGGAGYIGSQIVLKLIEKNYKPIVLDNLSTGNVKSIPNDVTFINGDIKSSLLVKKIIKKYFIKNVIHLAAYTKVEESIINPPKYYSNNLINTISFLNACGESKIKNIIFSSTAACYGKKTKRLVKENSMLKPINPYGKSKLLAESAIIDLSKFYNLRYGLFRFFNVAGADSKLRTGPFTIPSNHLIAKICENYLGLTKNFEVFGNNYKTKDGTCERDYVHVMDVAEAHVNAIDYLNHNNSFISNLGYGKGYSVLEVLDALKQITKEKINFKISKKRKGDVASIIADNSFAINKLGWKPRYDNLNLIIKHQLEWFKKLHGKKK